ncbi:hypothetical protein MCETHM1_03213 [Flavobacteriaceae bacterium]|jgi:hypothetical protein
MNKIKLFGVIAVLGSSMFFSTPSQAKVSEYCYAGEVMSVTSYSIFGITLYESIPHLTGRSC